MVLRTDFLTDGADHNRMFNFELDLCRTINREEERRKLNEFQKNQRFKSVVCRHWVKDLCMKQQDCEFLHELSAQRMPECRWGEKCQVPDCMFKHTKEEDRQECMFYKTGFCKKGLMCRFRHIRYQPEECSEELNWDEVGDNRNLTVTEITAVEDGVEKKTLVQHNENYKVAICKHWKNGMDCPFGARCHFAHGTNELRGKSLEGTEPAKPVPESQLQTLISHFQESSTNRDPKKDLGADLDLPDKEFLSSRSVPPIYFIIRTTAMEHVAASLKYECWAIFPSFMEKLNQAFESRAPVFLFVYANDTNLFAGVARMTSLVEHVKDPPDFVNLPPEAVDDQGHKHAFLFRLDWLRIGELQFTNTAWLMIPQPELDQHVPVAMAFECSVLPVETGHALMVMLYREPQVNIDVAQLPPTIKLAIHVEGPDPALAASVDSHLEQMEQFDLENPGVRPRLADMSASQESSVGAGNVPIAPGSMHVKTSGFVIGCKNPQFLQEMLGRGLIAAPIERGDLISRSIGPGTLLVIHSHEEGKVYGIYEAVRPADTYEQQAFLGSSNECLLPVQLPFQVALDAPPLDTSKIPPIVLQTDGGDCDFKTVHQVEMQKLANLFAHQLNDGVSQVAAVSAPSSGPSHVSADFPPGVSVQESPSNRPGTFFSSVIVNVPFHKDFKAAHQMIGKGGANINRVKERTGAQCSVQALSKLPQDGEISGPMQIKLTCNDAAKMSEAIEMVKMMANDIVQKFEKPLPRDDRGYRNDRSRGRDDRSVASSEGGYRNNRDDNFPRPRNDFNNRRERRDDMSVASGDSRGFRNDRRDDPRGRGGGSYRGNDNRSDSRGGGSYRGNDNRHDSRGGGSYRGNDNRSDSRGGGSYRGNDNRHDSRGGGSYRGNDNRHDDRFDGRSDDKGNSNDSRHDGRGRGGYRGGRGRDRSPPRRR